MNSTASDSITRAASLLSIESGPPFGAGSMTPGDEKLFLVLAHLFPLIVWPWKRRASPVIDAHGKEALNFGITMFVAFFALGFAGSLLAMVLGTWVAFLVSAVTVIGTLGALALVVLAILKGREGRFLRYPFCVRLIK
jgi:uncharacterized Tic20 family protein